MRPTAPLHPRDLARRRACFIQFYGQREQAGMRPVAVSLDLANTFAHGLDFYQIERIVSNDFL